MSADQAGKLAHQLILVNNTFLYSGVEQKSTFTTGKAVSEAVKRWLAKRS